MKTVNPYLNFPGNAEEAFNFYRSVFGGEFKTLMRYKDTQEGDKLAPQEKEKIMHIALPLGKGNTLMASDLLESMGQKSQAGNNFAIALETESEKETDKIFNALSQGGKVVMPLGKVFWGEYFGMVTDKFGIQWMIGYPYDQQKK